MDEMHNDGKIQMLKCTLVFVALLALTHTASANMGAADLKRDCESADPAYKLICFGYLQGVIDAWNFTNDTFAKTPLGSGIFTCMPEGIPETAVQGIVSHYLDDHPAQLRFSAISEVGAALEEAYPCPRNPK